MPLSLSVTHVTINGKQGFGDNYKIKVFPAAGIKEIGGTKASSYTSLKPKLFEPVSSGILGTITATRDNKSGVSTGLEKSIVFEPVSSGQLIGESIIDRVSAISMGSELLKIVNPSTIIIDYEKVPIQPNISLPRVLQVFSTAFSTTGGATGESWS